MPHWTAAQIPDQTGKLVIITGANSGIGYYSALELARKGAKVILACRDLGKGEAAKALIQKEIPKASIEVAQVDVADLKSVASFAKDFLARNLPLDILINNAGIMAPSERYLTPDGFESQWATNHLGHFALTAQLLPALEMASSGRVVSVSSVAHRRGAIHFTNLNSEKSYKKMSAYAQSKLANIIFGIELQKRLEKAHSKVISVIAHPGFSNTALLMNGFGKKPSLTTDILKSVSSLFMQPAAQGALPLLYAATSPDAKGGKYYGPHSFGNTQGYPVEEQPNRSALDPKVNRKLWEVSEQATGVAYS